VARPSGKLVAIASPPGESTAQKPPQQRSSGRESRTGFWLLAVLLGVAVAAVAFQTSRVDELSGQVESLQTELSTTRAALNSYESRFSEIRSSVGELRSQLTELETLVEERPASTP
jgi:uncharacterized protein HemX